MIKKILKDMLIFDPIKRIKCQSILDKIFQLKSQKDFNEEFNLSETNNIIGGSLSQLEASVRDKHTVSFGTDYSIEGFNETLKKNAGEVFESLMTLDAWFGGLKEKLMAYVSTLESKSFTDMQEHLSNGAKFAFEAFDIKSCQESS